VNGGRTSLGINRITPNLMEMESFAFHDTFRLAREEVSEDEERSDE